MKWREKVNKNILNNSINWWASYSILKISHMALYSKHLFLQEINRISNKSLEGNLLA